MLDDKIPNRPTKPEIYPPDPLKRPIVPNNEPDTIPKAEPIVSQD